MAETTCHLPDYDIRETTTNPIYGPPSIFAFSTKSKTGANKT